MTVKTEVVFFDLNNMPGAISEEAQATLEKFYIKWSELLSDVGVLPQPLHSIVELAKEEIERREKENTT